MKNLVLQPFTAFFLKGFNYAGHFNQESVDDHLVIIAMRRDVFKAYNYNSNLSTVKILKPQQPFICFT